MIVERKMAWSQHSYKFEPNQSIFKVNDPGKSQYEDRENEEYGAAEALIHLPKLLDTPWGNMIHDDDLNPYREFEFWVGHTNFDITQEVFDVLNSAPGVEALQLISRYRFIIGVGKLFAFQDVRADLQSRLCGTSVDTNNLVNRIESLKKEFTEANYLDWAIYVFPNGSLDFCWLEPDSSNIDEFSHKKDLLIKLKAMSNGQYIQYESIREAIPQEE